MFWRVKFSIKAPCSTFRKSRSWFTKWSSRWLLRSIIFKSFRALSGIENPEFMIFSNGPIMSVTGVLISWAIIVKNCILVLYNSFSFAWFNSFISSSWRFFVRNLEVLNSRYKPANVRRKYRNLKPAVSQKGGWITITIDAPCSFHSPSLFDAFTRKVYLPAGKLV